MTKVTISEAVRRKWKTAAEKEWWYQKFATVRRRKLVRLSEQQGHRCCYCERLTWMFAHNVQSALSDYDEDRLPGMGKGAMATLEHIVATSGGGTEHSSNLIMSCYRCNTLRSNYVSAMEFWEIMHDPIRYRAFITRGRLWSRQLKKLHSAKRRIKRDQTAFSLACLLVRFPEMSMVFAAWSAWLDEELHNKYARISWRLQHYTEGTCLNNKVLTVDDLLSPAQEHL